MISVWTLLTVLWRVLSCRKLSVIKSTAVPATGAVLLDHHSVRDAHEGAHEQHDEEDQEQGPDPWLNPLEEAWTVLGDGVGQAQQVPKSPARWSITHLLKLKGEVRREGDGLDPSCASVHGLCMYYLRLIQGFGLKWGVLCLSVPWVHQQALMALPPTPLPMGMGAPCKLWSGQPLSPELCCRAVLFSAYWLVFPVDLKSALWVVVSLALVEPQTNVYVACFYLSRQGSGEALDLSHYLAFLWWSPCSPAQWDHGCDCQLWRGLGTGFLFFCEGNNLNQIPLSLGSPDPGAISDLIRD